MISGDREQCGEVVGGVKQFAASAGEDDVAAIEDDRLLRQIERQPGMLLDEYEGKIVFALKAIKAGQ